MTGRNAMIVVNARKGLRAKYTRDQVASLGGTESLHHASERAGGEDGKCLRSWQSGLMSMLTGSSCNAGAKVTLGYRTVGTVNISLVAH